MSIDDNDYELTSNRVLDDNILKLTRFMNTQFFRSPTLGMVQQS